MREVRKLLLVTAGCLLVLGIGLGLFLSVYSDGEDCGSPFREGEGLRSDSCDGARAASKALPVTLIGLGLSAGVAALVVRPD